MKKLLKIGAIFAALCFLLTLFLWWRLPDVINIVVNRELVNRGFENSVIKVSDAGTKHLALEHAKLSGAGWDIQVKDSAAKFELQKILNLKQLDSIIIEQLDIDIDPSKLEESGDPLTIAFLESIPTQQLTIESGRIGLELDSGKLTVEFSTEISLKENNTIEFVMTMLRVEQISPAGQSTFNLPLLQDPEGLIHGTIALNGSNASLRWNIQNYSTGGSSWNIAEASSQGDLAFQNLDISEIPLADTTSLLPRFAESGEGTVTLSANQIGSNSISAEWIGAQLNLIPETDLFPNKANLTVSAGTLGFAAESLEQISVELKNEGDLSKIKSIGDISFLYEGIEGKLHIALTAENLLSDSSLIGEYKLNPMIFDYSDVIGRHISSFSDLIVSGTLAANGRFTQADGVFDASSVLTLTEGSLILPSSSLDAEGIQSQLSISSVNKSLSSPGDSYLHIETIETGDLRFQNTQLSFDILDLKTLNLTKAETELFDGILSIPATTFQLNPMSFETQIGFERLSLNSIVSGMESFNGTMEGAISGHLPLSLVNGSFNTDEGYLTLAEGETARLRYNTDRLFEPTAPEKKGFFEAIGDKILNKLKLAPEKVVEDALSDLTIHELRVDLFPENNPDTPAKIHLAGEGLTGKTIVPMVLDTNINGTTDELLQALMRIHSLGTPSLE